MNVVAFGIGVRDDIENTGVVEARQQRWQKKNEKDVEEQDLVRESPETWLLRVKSKHNIIAALMSFTPRCMRAVAAVDTPVC